MTAQKYPRFKFLGHACVLIELENFSIITDPWFKSPIHFETFYQFPEVILPSREEISRIKYIHISHIHQDHFCIESLKKFYKDSEVIICDFSQKDFYNKVRSLGFKKIHQVTPWAEGLELNNFTIKTYTPENFDGSFDSSFSLEINGLCYYFSNDCILSELQYANLTSSIKRFQGAFLTCIGISPYPACFSVDIPNKQNWRAQKLEQRALFYKKHFEEFCNQFNCVWACAYAGDIRFLHYETKYLNDIFSIDVANSISMASTQLIKISNGDRVDSLGYVYKNTNFQSKNYTTTDNIHQLSTEPQYLNPVKIQKFFQELLKNNSGNWTQPVCIEFKILGCSQALSFSYCVANNEIELRNEAPDISIDLQARFVKMLVSGEITFKQMLYSYRFKVTIYKYIHGQMNILLWN